MSASYGQFCPIAKASEIFATRWTPLIVREMMTGVHSFNDIHRGVPLISRAVLVARLRDLEDHGVIERRPRGADGAGHEYWLTPAGEGLRVVMHALGQWGMTYTHDRIKRSDLDPALLIWGLRKRVDLSTLPDRRVVLRFEFSGVPASRTKFRIMWLILGRFGVDVCMKDPGFAIDLTLRGNIRDYVEVYLGHTNWRDVVGTALQLDGDLQIARAFPVWLRFETVNGLNAPAPHLSAGPAPVQTDHSDRLPSDPSGMRARSPGGPRATDRRRAYDAPPGSAVLGSVRLSLERGDLEPGPVGAPGTSTACLVVSSPPDSHGPAKMRGPERPQVRSEDRSGSR